MHISIPECPAAAVLKMVVKRDPAGPYKECELIDIDPATPEVFVCGLEDAHVDIELIAVDADNNRSKPVILKKQLADSSLLAFKGGMDLLGIKKTDISDIAEDLPGVIMADIEAEAGAGAESSADEQAAESSTDEQQAAASGADERTEAAGDSEKE